MEKFDYPRGVILIQEVSSECRHGGICIVVCAHMIIYPDVKGSLALTYVNGRAVRALEEVNTTFKMGGGSVLAIGQ